MFTNYCIHNIFDYICAQNAQCWARITKSDMEIQRYNRLKIVLAEKERTGTWLSEQMGHSISTVSRWMTNRSALWDACQSKKVQPSVEQLYEYGVLHKPFNYNNSLGLPNVTREYTFEDGLVTKVVTKWTYNGISS